MFLPIYISDYFVSTLLVDHNTFQVSESVYARIPYTPNYAESFLTKKKLNNLIETSFKSEFSKMADRIYIASKSQVNDIAIDYLVKDVIKVIPFQVILLDYYQYGDLNKLNADEVNNYINKKIYSMDMPEKIRNKIETNMYTAFLQANVSGFNSTSEFSILTNPVSSKLKKKYIQNLVDLFADVVKVHGAWKFNVDDSFSILPLVAVLMNKGIDLHKHFKENPIRTDAKLIINKS